MVNFKLYKPRDDLFVMIYGLFVPICNFVEGGRVEQEGESRHIKK